MLPGSTSERTDREAAKGKQSGRTQEIQRLIGRSLRAVSDLPSLGEVQITVDCDVLQADGGTRTASICGGYVALHDACTRLVAAKRIAAHPLTDGGGGRSRSASSTRSPCLDLALRRGRRAEVDMNVVMTGVRPLRRGAGHGRGRGRSPRPSSTSCSALAEHGIAEIFDAPARGAGQRRRRPDERPAMRLVLATANPDKAAEIAAMLGAAVPDLELAAPPGVRPRRRGDRARRWTRTPG